MPGRESLRVTGSKTIKENQKYMLRNECVEAISRRNDVLGVKLPKWAVEANLKPRLRSRILCFKTEKEDEEVSDRVFVPATIKFFKYNACT